MAGKDLLTEARKKHNLLCIKLDGMITKDSFQSMKRMAMTYLDPKQVEKANNMNELLRKLEEKGVLAVGEYDTLIELMNLAGIGIGIDDIRKTDTEIQIIMQSRIHTQVACSGPTASTSSSSNSTRIPNNGPINTISSLRPSQKGWRICVRVTNKNTISKYKKYGGWNQRFNVSFADDSGSIEAVAFGEAVDKFYELLKEQRVYYISGATIKKANSKFSQGNAYDMVLEIDTNIELCDDEDNLGLATEISYNYVEIDKLEPGRLYDVVGVVKDFQTKTIGKWSRIEVHIVDRSKKMVPLRLNMKDVENLDLSENPVIAVKGAWLKNSHGHIYLKKMPNTKIKTNPDTRETDLLQRWFAREGHQIEFEKI